MMPMHTWLSGSTMGKKAVSLPATSKALLTFSSGASGGRIASGGSLSQRLMAKTSSSLRGASPSRNGSSLRSICSSSWPRLLMLQLTIMETVTASITTGARVKSFTHSTTIKTTAKVICLKPQSIAAAPTTAYTPDTVLTKPQVFAASPTARPKRAPMSMEAVKAPPGTGRPVSATFRRPYVRNARKEESKPISPALLPENSSFTELCDVFTSNDAIGLYCPLGQLNGTYCKPDPPSSTHCADKDMKAEAREHVAQKRTVSEILKRACPLFSLFAMFCLQLAKASIPRVCAEVMTPRRAEVTMNQGISFQCQSLFCCTKA
mmetsp:Transcript_96611/g.256753  ORF Transcript_96611/g.256753 Transcript_96611/m.256753 type:complete len:320 (+) Transcript_96611:329-1288(+)